MKIALIDDDPSALDVLRLFVSRLPNLEVIGEFDRISRAEQFLRKQTADLLLLDISLPDGDAFRLLDALPYRPAVILTTSSLVDSLQAFDYGVIDYLVKPIRFDRFQEAIHRVGRRQPDAAPVLPTAVMLKDGRGLVQIRLADIRYIEAKGAYSLLHLPQKTVLVNHLLADLQELLPTESFLRSHRSYIVGVAHITRLSMLLIEVGEQKIPIGIRYRKALKNRVTPH